MNMRRPALRLNILSIYFLVDLFLSQLAIYELVKNTVVDSLIIQDYIEELTQTIIEEDNSCVRWFVKNFPVSMSFVKLKMSQK